MTLNALLVSALLAAAPKAAEEPKPDATVVKVNTLLKTMADSPDKKDRTAAADELLRMGKTAVPALSVAVKHDSATIRYHAVAVLGGIGSDAVAAVPELIEVAKSKKEDAGVRQRAVYALGAIRADEKRCVPFLLETLQGEDRELDELAGEALGKFGAKAKAAVPGLTKMVEGRKGKLEVVVTVLGKIGPEAKAAVPALKALLEDAKYAQLRPTVGRALEQIQTDPK